MHQQSLRILRWTEDDRPFTKDFHDLFCTLMISLPLTAHRVRLTKKPQSFTTGEAVAHLGNLRFTQSNRRPSPHDPNMWVTTKIATTFSMVPHMARYLCDKFLAARLIDSAEGKTGFAANAADAVWQLTSKGLCILQQFAHRNGVQERNVYEALDSPRNNVQLLVLERDPETDALTCDRATVDVIFRRFAGSEGGSSKPSSPHSDSDSANESLHVAGVKVLQRKVGGKVYPYTMTGKDVIDWLMTCCTLVDGGEAEVIARLFTSYGLLDLIQDDKCTAEARFPSTKNAVFHVTEEGQETARWISSRRPSRKPCTIRDSNASKMMLILTTPSMRLLFREFLRDTHCEENLTFYTEVNEFLQKWRRLEAKHGATGSVPIPCSSETLAGAYDLYNAYLAPGSPCELNIDHTLRNALVSRMTKFELPDEQLLSTVHEVVELYDQAMDSVHKLMAADSVPKFLRDPRYAHVAEQLNGYQYVSTTTTSQPQAARGMAAVLG